MSSSSPAFWLCLAALLPLSAGLFLGWRWRRPGHLGARLLRLLGACALLLAASLLGVLGISLFGYARLLQETEVATLIVQRSAAQRFSVELHSADGQRRRFELQGEQWQLDARVLRWKLPALLAGAPSLYRLERLSSRYVDAAQELEAPRSVHALDHDAFPDLWTLRRQFPQFLDFVDADFGSGAYVPLIDGARYSVSLGPRGGLVARAADAETEALMRAAGW
jgi:hypothetical protein